jgi:hypothetical protein
LENRVRPELRHFGTGRHPVVVIDEFTGRLEEILAIAEEVAPFPAAAGNYYPGLRRLIDRSDAAAEAYVERTCEDAGQFIAGAFDFTEFDLLEASFSMVTVPPSELALRQRAPHFDSTDPGYLALLHYLRVPDGSGTAFYRQRSTGIERVTALNASSYVPVAQLQAAQLPAGSGYITGSDNFYEQIGAVEAVPDRLVIYQGSLLHSGIIPDGMTFSADPREGRLTANIFVRGH